MENEMESSATVEISTKVLRALEFIEKIGVTGEQLRNMYRNTAEAKGITEIEREMVTQKLESVMRSSFPKDADKLFGKRYGISSGNKSAPAVELLEEVYAHVTQEFEWAENLHKNGVKVGGSMVGGRQYLAWYLSFKGHNKWGTSFSYRQDAEDSPPRVEVSIYQGSMNLQSDRIEKDLTTFSLDEVDNAVSHFKDCLITVKCPMKVK
jgi:hypothetical protein